MDPKVIELVEYIAEGHKKDVFYSDVYRYAKNRKLDGWFQDICKALAAKGVEVHS